MDVNMLQGFLVPIKKDLAKFGFTEVPEPLILKTLELFTRGSGAYTDSKCITGIFKVSNYLVNDKGQKAIDATTDFAIQMFMDARKFNRGDEVVMHQELDDITQGNNPIIVSVIHFLYTNYFLDLLITKSFINNKVGYEGYVAKAKALGFRTVEETVAAIEAESKASADAIQDTSSAPASEVAPGPQICE